MPLTRQPLLALAFALAFAALPMPSPAAETAIHDVHAVEAVLRQYKDALERLDLKGVDALFAKENTVVESGKVEGAYADYLVNHIGPELGHFRSFTFSDYKVDTRMEGDIALATETYRYTIVLKDKPEPIERQAVATSVLKKVDGRWQILSMHSSSRAPRPAKPAAKPAGH
ncbi:MAG: nuclear transport factor 2 family protein [Pseudomonadota bacterium]